MPEFIRTLKRKLVEIYINGRDSNKAVEQLTERCAKLKVLLKDLRAYNRVLVRDYETFLDELQRQL